MRKQLGLVVCLRCGQRVVPLLHQVRERYVNSELVPIQRVKCRRCGKTFRVLPEWAIPYKHYGASPVEAVVNQRQAGLSLRGVARWGGIARPVVRRWIKWWSALREWLQAAELVSWLEVPGWLPELLRTFPCWRSCRECGRR